MPWRTCRVFNGPDDANGYGLYRRLYWTRERSSNETCRDSGCSGVKVLKHTCGNDPSKFLATKKKAQSGRGQVTLKTQRRRTTAPIAEVGAKNHRTRRLRKLAREVEDLGRQLHRHVHQVGGLGCGSVECSSPVGQSSIVRCRVVARRTLGDSETLSPTFPGASLRTGS